MKPNDTIAVIIIVLFLVLAAIAFGIWRIVHVTKRSFTATETTTTVTTEIVD
jgi:flagellar basal body-associated protein FliL